MKIVSKLIIVVGIVLLVVIATWSYFNIKYQKKNLIDHIIDDTGRLTETIRLGTHYAMTLNSRDEIHQIVKNIGKQPEIERIDIYNKEGLIKYSSVQDRIDLKTNMKSDACSICHKTDPPVSSLEDLSQRVRIFNSSSGDRLLSVVSPLCNEKGCSTAQCHVHPEDKKVLGALEVVVSLNPLDKKIATARNSIIGLAVLAFIVISTFIFIFVHKLINLPIQRLIHETRLIADGKYKKKVNIRQNDELGQLSEAINKMCQQIKIQQTELNKQRNEYMTLFDNVPCLITVQDRSYKLLHYNKLFKEKFHPDPGTCCFEVYKGFDCKCEDDCPIEKTFQDGKSHYGETSGVEKNGEKKYWIYITAPLKNADGEIVAGMEMSLDITPRRKLEKRLQASEKKYQSIFDNIPNPVFLLEKQTLEVLDCNNSVKLIYGFNKEEIVHHSFLDLFIKDEREKMGSLIKSSSILNRIKHLNKEGRLIYVDIWISPAEYNEQKQLLVTTSDITKRLEAEEELIQAGKLATLGEMSTGVAHELNQPLSVIKTASDFILKKMGQNKAVEESVLSKLLFKINTNIDRASKIIEHMRDFARKSDINFEDADVNKILKRAYDIFSQQLKVRGIEVVWELMDTLPAVTIDPGRIEQVFINLLVNARDAIEEKSSQMGSSIENEKIFIQTMTEKGHIVVKIKDTGIGISREIRDKIFDPFFTTKEIGKGTGIGLSISYGIIKECKGQIEAVSNKKSPGVTFIVRFPFAKNQQAFSS